MGDLTIAETFSSGEKNKKEFNIKEPMRIPILPEEWKLLKKGSKVISYYDWSFHFKEERENNKNGKNKLNSVGMEDDDFKKYLKKWKKENT